MPDPRSVHRLHAPEKARQRTVLLLGTVLFVVLGVSALLWTIVIDAPATAQSNPGAENEAIARRFYDAVNDAVRTGDLSPGPCGGDQFRAHGRRGGDWV